MQKGFDDNVSTHESTLNDANILGQLLQTFSYKDQKEGRRHYKPSLGPFILPPGLFSLSPPQQGTTIIKS